MLYFISIARKSGHCGFEKSPGFDRYRSGSKDLQINAVLAFERRASRIDDAAKLYQPVGSCSLDIEVDGLTVAVSDHSSPSIGEWRLGRHRSVREC